MYTYFSDRNLQELAESAGLSYDRTWGSRVTVLTLANVMEQRNSNSDGISFHNHDWSLASGATILYPAKGSGGDMWSTQYDAVYDFKLRTDARATVSLRCNGTNKVLLHATTDRSGRHHTFPEIAQGTPLQMVTSNWMGCHFASTKPFTKYTAIGIQQTHRRDFESFIKEDEEAVPH